MNQAARQLLATISYRMYKSCKGAGDSFASFNAGHGSRTPLEILYHIKCVIGYGIFVLTDEKQDFKEGINWQEESQSLNSMLEALDDLLRSGKFEESRIIKLIQGPIADVLTHVGQIAMLRRLHGSAIEKENFTRAQIEIGHFYIISL